MERRKYLSNILSNKFNEYVYVHVFRKMNCDNYTSNSNGIFIDLNNVADENIEEVIKFMEQIQTTELEYKKSEASRDENLQNAQDIIKTGKTSNKKKAKKTKSTKMSTRISGSGGTGANKIPVKKPLKGVYARIDNCMGRKRTVKEFVEISDEDNNSDKVGTDNENDISNEIELDHDTGTDNEINDLDNTNEDPDQDLFGEGDEGEDLF